MTKGLKIAAIAAVVGVVTYVGLEVVLPHHKVEVKLSGLVPADSVFDSKLKSPDEVAAAATPGADTVDASATTPSGPAVAGDDAMAPSADNGVDQSASSDTAPAADDGTRTMADDDADARAYQIAPDEAAPASPPPAPVKPVAAKPVAKPSKPASKPVEKKAPAAVASKSTPWWTSSGNDKSLQVIYVGSAAFERAIVVMGNAPFANASSASQNIHVSDASGKAVAGSWKLGSNNKAMLVFPVSKSGKFQVSVNAGLSDAKNRKLGQSVKGPVVVQ